MKSSAKQGQNNLVRLIFWASCFALIASFTIFVLEKSQITNFYNKPVSKIDIQVPGGPTGIIDYPINNNSESEKNTPPKKDSGTDKPVTSSALTGTINFKTVTSDTLALRTTIYQMIDGGDCTLTLTRTTDGKVVTKNAKIVANPSSATCNGFDIPLTELGPGKWSINIILSSGGKSGSIMGEVSI